MQEYELELHLEKTKMVYCENYQRHERHENESFTFVSYSFQPITVKSKFGTKRLLVFGTSIFNAAKQVSEQQLKQYCQRNGTHKN